MKTKTSPSDAASHRDALHRQLHCYALAASAAGVTVLALAQPTQAEIIYTPVDVTIGPNQHYDLDLNGDGVVDFTIRDQFKGSSSGHAFNLFVGHPAGNAVAAHIVNTGAFQWAYAFSSGFLVKEGTRHFGPGRVNMATSRRVGFSSYWRGSWAGSYGFGSGGYLGLKFKICGELHYGWARLTTDLFEMHTANLTGYAYETVPNKPIRTGQVQDDAGQARPAGHTLPERGPGTLGALARGSGGLSGWRARQGAASKPDSH